MEEEFLPIITDSFLDGQDILYKQFNQLNFYVEDTNKEQFYFKVLKKLFPSVAFEKIFPLNGKDNVIKAAQRTINDREKVYLVDLDFDDILHRKKHLENLFYLDRYSIENYLIEKQAIFEIIREKDPRQSNEEIEAKFNFTQLESDCLNLLTELSMMFLLIQKHSLGLKFLTINPHRDVNFSNSPASYKTDVYKKYKEQIEEALLNKDGRYTIKAQLRKIKNHFDPSLSLHRIPGKYLMEILKCKLEKSKLITQMNMNTFSYKLGKESELNSLMPLKKQIKDYIEN